MNGIERLRKWGRRAMETMKAGTGAAREFRDIFELGGVPAYRRFYDSGVFVWKALYRGSYAPWHMVPAPTIADPKAMRQMYRLNAAKAATAELAGLVWGEQCDIRVSMNDAPEGEPDPLDEFVHSVLRENAFYEKMQQCVEQSLALGGAAIKVWYEPAGPEADGCRLSDPAGNPSVSPAGCQLPLKGAPGWGANGEDAGKIRLGYCMADQFVPTAWDNAQVKEAVFISREAKDGWYYTRLEWHRRDGGGYAVDNELYRSKLRSGGIGQPRDILGARVPLEDAYPWLDAHTEVRARDSLFTYWRTPIANNLDDDSPLGISIYGNALETLRALDICYDSFVQEFELGKKRIIVPARCVRTVADPATGEMRRYFDPGDRVYEALATDDPEGLKIQDNSVELRVEEHIAALNAFLSILCLQLGFSANTFSFDGHNGLKTATEVISENSKTYKTVRTVQNQLAPAMEHLARNIVDMAVLCGMRWKGEPVERLAAKGYSVKAVFDDGVTQDRQTNIAEGLRLVSAGLLSKYRFLTDAKYGQCLTPREAEEELERVKSGE